METFKQYFNQKINEMSDRTPIAIVKHVQNRIQSAHDVARQARRGRARQQEVAAAMQAMVDSHKELDKYSSHDLKNKIVDKYNDLKTMLQGESTDGYTIENLEDCVQYLTILCDDILAG